MSRVLSINLPDQLLDRLDRLASASHRPVEEMVVAAIRESIPHPPPGLPSEIRNELLGLEVLPDSDLVAVAQSTSRAHEIPATYTPGDASDRLALRKAYALVLLKWRGRPLPELEPVSN